VCLLRGGWHPLSTNLVLSLNTLRVSYGLTPHVILFEHLNSYSFSSRASDQKNLTITSFISYSNADIDKFAILKDNQDKIGIYRWVNLDTGKSYVGSSRNLSARFRQYFNVNYLEREIKRNNSKIYRSLFKNGYSKFSLNILEYCEIDILIEREQYYIDTLKPEYNILSKAGSLAGFKHSVAARELMSIKKMNNVLSEEARLKIAIAINQGVFTLVHNVDTGEVLSFVSIRKAVLRKEFLGIPQSSIAKSIQLKGFFLDKGNLVYKSSTTADEIFSLESYIEAISVKDLILKPKHSEASKELIRKANIDKTLTEETKQKISLNSKNAKPVLVTNNETKEMLEFPSAVSAGKFLNVDESYVRRCISSNRSCKGHTISRKSTS